MSTLELEHIKHSSASGNNITLAADGSITVDTTTFKVDATNNRVGIGTTSPDGGLHVKGVSDHGKIIVEHGGTSGSTNHNFISFHNHAGNTVAEIQSEENATNQSALLFKTGGTTTNMTITKEGYVLKPNQVSFKAYRLPDGSWSVGANSVFVWTHTEHNIGNCYNTSNGRFTAPVAGSYQINYHTINYGTINNGWISLRKNGSRFNGGDVHYTNESDFWHFSNNAMTVYLNSGDYLEVYAGNADEFHGGNWSHFSGFLIG